MNKAIIVTGHIADPTHIELEKPLTDLVGRVEIVIRAVPKRPSATPKIMDYIDSLTAGRRTKSDIDSKLSLERDEWDKRG